MTGNNIKTETDRKMQFLPKFRDVLRKFKLKFNLSVMKIDSVGDNLDIFFMPNFVTSSRGSFLGVPPGEGM